MFSVWSGPIASVPAVIRDIALFQTVKSDTVSIQDVKCDTGWYSIVSYQIISDI